MQEFIERSRVVVVCMLHSEMGKPVPAQIDTIESLEGDEYTLVRCRACLEFGKQLLSAQKKKQQAEMKNHVREVIEKVDREGPRGPLLCIGCGSEDPKPPPGATRYRCDACVEKGVPWPDEPKPRFKRASIDPKAEKA